MHQRIYSPRVLATSSSLVGEDSLSHHVDRSIGVYIIDRYAYYIQKFLDGKVRSLDSNISVAEYMKACSKSQCISTVAVRTDLYKKKLKTVRVTDFFGSRRYFSGIHEDSIYNKDDLNFILAQSI